MSESPPLFWRERYARIQSESSVLAGVRFDGSLTWNDEEAHLRTWIVFDILDVAVKSPCKATFGGAWSRSADHLITDLRVLLASLADWQSDKAVSIYLPPRNLGRLSSQIQEVEFLEAGGTIDFIDLNYWIDVPNWSLGALSKGNRKKLRQWREANGNVFRAPREQLPVAYSVILENRRALGVEPSISLEGLSRLFDVFPENYELYLAVVDDVVAAAAVTVQILSDTKYVFFWADSPDMRHLSPVVAVCEHLVERCRTANIEMLDLGISTDRGIRNDGLIRFKHNLGAHAAEKPSIVFRPGSVPNKQRECH